MTHLHSDNVFESLKTVLKTHCAIHSCCQTSTIRLAFRQSQDEPAQPKHASDALLKLLRDLIPDNIAAAATNMNILGIIFFSVFFGTALSLLRHDEGCKQIIGGVEAFNKIIIKMVRPSQLASCTAPLSSCNCHPDLVHIICHCHMSSHLLCLLP